MGYKAVHQRLRRRYGVYIPRYCIYATWNSPNSTNVTAFLWLRDVVAAMLSALDSVGVEQRTRGRLVRQHYYSKVRCIDLTWHSNQDSGPKLLLVCKWP